MKFFRPILLCLSQPRLAPRRAPDLFLVSMGSPVTVVAVAR